MLVRARVSSNIPGFSQSNFKFGIAKTAFSQRNFASTSNNTKPKVLFLGSGWSSVFFIKNLNPKLFDLTVISPRNYFTFTPLLPKILSGMVESNTSAEPIIEYMRRYFRTNSQFIHAKCVDVDSDSNCVTCAPLDSGPAFSVSYDFLVIAVGAQTNTFGTKGVEEYAYFLKELEHAELAFQRIVDNFRAASMPSVTNSDRKRLLHFLVVGGGPTGVESAGELSVLMNSHLGKIYPELMPFVKVSIVEAGQRLLPSLAQNTSKYVLKVFSKSVNMYFGKVVSEVREKSCILKELASGNTEEVECGLVLWASGLKETDLVMKLKRKWNVPEGSRALLVDQYLRLQGSNNIFCLGDCCKITPKKLSENVKFVLERVKSPTLEALVKARKMLSRDFPQLNGAKCNFNDPKFQKSLSELSERCGDGTEEWFVEVLRLVDQGYCPPFPTAQNAKQEAIYLSKLFNSGAVLSGNYVNAFCDKWKGTLASLGGLRVVMNSPLINLNGGLFPLFLWNTVYMLMFSSLKMRLSFAFDMLKNFLFSRHLILKKYN
ncbi:Pyridine nucleotide-disulfide oxidoreductase family protein [Theileria parva strain Muguga]|uniref:NADH:ubiquinone reductase (non-electrogenic) n=1 Tax=Theileria parva TaxID=5875 RepID=Q4MZ90_THEPA|nr:NADH dehydrogenase [Theileria parva strain Muguga]EAN31284.1 Pyridine nucleotide-disulfide oxidoreductase family protein [Theileria parva strain Muguga]|eukprot:XP_763567.1 NADH dehydrogenase [Theileria parva strain Muguga]